MSISRRNFLALVGATSASPLLPASFIRSGLASAVTTNSIPHQTVEWASTIVRAHRKCSSAMLQRHLQIDANSADMVRSLLIENGTIVGNPDAYGFHKAINPLSDDAFLKSPQPANKNESVDPKDTHRSYVIGPLGFCITEGFAPSGAQD